MWSCPIPLSHVWPDGKRDGKREFQIQDECTEADCAVVDGVTMPTALKVRDGEKVYTLDTGSDAAVLLHCQQGPLSSVDIPVHYGSENAVNKVLERPEEILGETFRPFCNISGLAASHQDGLIGVSPQSTSAAPHSYMNNVAPGERRLVVDKETKTVCFGSGCKGPGGSLDEAVIIPVNRTVTMPAFLMDGKRYVLDTGSTNSIGYGKDLCIIGNHEIRKLDVDYDASRVAYDVDMEAVGRLCEHQLV